MIHTWVVNCKWMTSPCNSGWKRLVMFGDEYLKQSGPCLPRIDCQYTATPARMTTTVSTQQPSTHSEFRKNNEHKNLWVAALTCNMLHNVTCPCRKQGRKEVRLWGSMSMNLPSVTCCSLLSSPRRHTAAVLTSALLTLSRLLNQIVIKCNKNVIKLMLFYCFTHIRLLELIKSLS